MSKLVYSKQSAYVADGSGNSRFIGIGETLSSEDPVVATYPSMFTDDPTPFMRNTNPVSNRALETATSEPGEKRHVVAPKRAEKEE